MSLLYYDTGYSSRYDNIQVVVHMTEVKLRSWAMTEYQTRYNWLLSQSDAVIVFQGGHINFQTILNCVCRLLNWFERSSEKSPSWLWWPSSSVVGKNDRSLQKNTVKENQLSWSKVQMKGLVGEDAIVLSVQCFATLHESTNSYYLDTIQKLELFSHHTPSSAAFKPRKFSLCIHSVQACCIDALV